MKPCSLHRSMPVIGLLAFLLLPALLPAQEWYEGQYYQPLPLPASPQAMRYTPATGRVDTFENSPLTGNLSVWILDVTPRSGIGNALPTLCLAANEGVRRRAAGLSLTGTGLSEKTISIKQEFSGLHFHPHPTFGDATLAYQVDKTAHIRIKCFAADGKRLALLLDADSEPGDYTLPAIFSALPAGAYFLQMEADVAVSARRFVKL